jgi:hypothetical protein
MDMTRRAYILLGLALFLAGWNVLQVALHHALNSRLLFPPTLEAATGDGPETPGQQVTATWATETPADLATIDRTIPKEPAYQSEPRYCLLVFGPAARSRVWLVLDGDLLYVDRNGNGDLTEAGERVEAPKLKPSSHPFHARERSIEADIVATGDLTHGLTVGQIEYRRKVGATGAQAEEWQEHLDAAYRQVPDGMTYHVEVRLDPRCYGTFVLRRDMRILHFAWLDGRGHLVFARRPEDAPVLHFGGPLTLRGQQTDKLQRGEDPGRTTVYLGTPGLGPGTFVHMLQDLVPKDAHPVVQVRFPPKAPGQAPATRKYLLKERC